MNRRLFLESVGSAAAAVAALRPTRILAAPDSPEHFELGARRRASFELRKEVALDEFRVPVPHQRSNGDEERYPNRIANYSKGLPHNDLGEVDLDAYGTLLQALSTGDPADFEQISMGAPAGQRMKLVNPQAGLAFDMEGTDSHQLAMPPAPSFDSREQAAEMVEDYWMALARDVNFTDYASDPIARSAAAELSKLTGFMGPRDTAGNVTPQTLFRGPAPGAVAGPYLSQFLLLPARIGSETISSRQQTVVPGLDYLTEFPEWLAVQNGTPRGPNQFDPIRRYMRNGRDLSNWVHADALFQAYFLGALILLQLNAPLNPGNPYLASQTQDGFGTFGPPFLLTVLVEGCTRALKTVWYQKWFVHRRLRPEQFAARVHNVKNHLANYPIHSDVLDSQAAAEAARRYGSYLLPHAFPEGCPLHPSYGAGHATVAGACVTMLKALFDGSVKIADLLRESSGEFTRPVVSSSDGLSLIPYEGDDRDSLTVEGELNKLAANVGLGRNHASVHWRTDDVRSFTLGEQVAISILRDQRGCYNETFSGFTFTKFDGTTVVV
jgi:hypothetical protein